MSGILPLSRKGFLRIWPEISFEGATGGVRGVSCYMYDDDTLQLLSDGRLSVFQK